MRIIRDEVTVPIGVEEAWQFFSDARNLERLMPPDMRMVIVELDDEPVHEGQIMVYRVRLAPLIWVPWVSEITRVEPGRLFVDDQRVGPYAFWHHTHEVEAVPGGTRLKDVVYYHVGFGPIGALLHGIAVDPMVDRIFEHRKKALQTIFPGGTGG